MAEESFQEKTEPATQRRRQDARKDGKVARSVELNSFAILFVGVLTLFFAMPLMMRQMSDVMRELFQSTATLNITVDQVPQLFFTFGIRLLIILAPVMIALTVAGLLVNFSQVGFHITGKPLEPKLDKLDLVKGLKKLVSMQSLVGLARNLLKLAIIGWIAYTAIRAESQNFISVLDSDVYNLLSFTGKAAFNISLKIALAMLVLALLDYAYQRWDFEKSIRMTKQEIREEIKQYEGSPITRSRMRRVQQELSRMRMSREIPKADVVITNPVHLAVALKYDAENMGAPTVVAKGARLLAEKIKEIARKHGVPIVENKPLARTLYQAVEIGMEIPANLYKAVAEVLAYVYRLKHPETAANR
jgi:flagellar biosynthetic protein FlhB